MPLTSDGIFWTLAGGVSLFMRSIDAVCSHKRLSFPRVALLLLLKLNLLHESYHGFQVIGLGLWIMILKSGRPSSCSLVSFLMAC